MRIFSPVSVLVFGLMLATTLAGCGQTGVTLRSAAYGTTVAQSTFLPFEWLDRMLFASAQAGAVTSFKLCVTKLKVEGEDGSEISNPNASGADDKAFDAPLGLVDLADGSSSVSWGNVSLPTGVALKRIKVEVHKDSSLCGVEYSASVNGETIAKDLEFKFLFNNAKTLNAGDAVQISMTRVIDAFSAAVLANAFTDQDIGNYFDSSDTSKDAEDSCN